MSLVVNTPLEYVEGIVARTNERGFTLRGREGWLNLSRYASPAPVVPPEGTTVRVGLDASGFVRSIEALAAPQEQAASTTPAGGREQAVTRLACLNTATAILSSGGREADPDDVMALAERLERWVQR